MTLRFTKDDDWQSRALCRRVKGDKFFPEGRPQNDALSLCDRCPVRRECIEAALNSPWKPYGIWGGLTTRELWPMWTKRHPRSRHNEILQLLGLAE